MVGDRHRLISLAAAPTARVGETVEFALSSLHAPAGASNKVELATSGDPGVLTLPAATAIIFSDAEILYIPAVGPGIAELVVRYGEQEVRASIRVE